MAIYSIDNEHSGLDTETLNLTCYHCRYVNEVPLTEVEDGMIMHIKKGKYKCEICNTVNCYIGSVEYNMYTN